MTALELRHHQPRHLGQRARLSVDRLRQHHPALGERNTLRQPPRRALALDLKHPLHLSDLADEEPAVLLRQQREDKAVVLVAGPHQRAHVGPAAAMHPIGHRHRNCDLLPQASRPAGEERDSGA